MTTTATATMPKPAKMTPTQLNTLRYCHVYSNDSNGSTIIAYHEKQDKEAGLVEFVTVWRTEMPVIAHDPRNMTDHGSRVPDVHIYFGCAAAKVLFCSRPTRIEITFHDETESMKERGLWMTTTTLVYPEYSIDTHQLHAADRQSYDGLNSIVGTDIQASPAKDVPDYDSIMRDGRLYGTRIANSPNAW